jgi:hypothetical protein
MAGGMFISSAGETRRKKRVSILATPELHPSIDDAG